MKRNLLSFFVLICLNFQFYNLSAQTNQTVTNGDSTAIVIFPGTACSYFWENNNPAIGLPANGLGNILPFVAINRGNSPIVDTVYTLPVETDFAYIPSSFGNNVNGNIVAKVDMNNNQLHDVISVGPGARGVSVSPDGRRVYVTDSLGVSVINTATDQVITNINVGSYPYGVVVSPNGKWVYAVGSGNGAIISTGNNVTGPGNVAVIDAGTNTVLTNIPVGSGLSGLAISPDGSRLYVANENDGTISVINTATNKVIKTITVGKGPYGVAVNPDGSKVYITNSLSNNISVIATATNTVSAIINVGQIPAGISVSPDGKTVYVANSASNSLSIINIASNIVISTIGVGTQPMGVSVSTDGNSVYVVNSVSNDFSVIKTSTNTVSTTVANSAWGFAPVSLGNFITGGIGCQNTSILVTFTVNPSSPALPVIIADSESGSISACAGNTSASPSIQQFIVTGSNLSSNITATAPPGFEISLSPVSGYSGNLLLKLTGGSVSKTIVYVRSAVSNQPGNISGKVLLNSPGAKTCGMPVSGTIKRLTTVNLVTDQIVNNGDSTRAINFTGSGSTFNWVNDTPGIGLPASGTGNINPFTAVNNGNSPITATVTVTSQPSGYAYIANRSDNSVSVINTTTNTVVSTIITGYMPWGVAVSPDGNSVYVAERATSDWIVNTLSVIDAATNTVKDTVFTDLNSTGVAVSPDGSRLYVSQADAGYEAVVNTTTGAEIARINTIQAGSNAVRVSPDGKWVYFTNENIGGVIVVDASTNTIVTTILTGTPTGSVFPDPSGLAVSPDGSRLYVANSVAGTLSVIDTKSNTISKTIALGAGDVIYDRTSWGVVVSPDGSKVYVAKDNANAVLVIDTQTNTISSTIPVGTQPFGVSLTKNGSFLYVTNYGDGTVSVINTANGSVIKTIQVGTNPISIGNFISEGTGCSGTPTQFRITVNPSPKIMASVKGSISTCVGTASANPEILNFTVSGFNLSGNIEVKPPMGFEVSLNPNTGYTDSIALVQSGGTVQNATFYVRLAASSVTGQINGNVLLSSPGALSQSIPVSGTVNPVLTPSVEISATASSICSGTSVKFTATPTNGGSAPIYQWLLNGGNTGTNSNIFTSSTLANGDIIKCKMTSNALCTSIADTTSNSITMIVNVSAIPSISIAASENSICSGTPVTFKATVVDGGNSPFYQWLINGNNVGNNSPAFTSSTLEDGDMVSCKITYNNNCVVPADTNSNIIKMLVNAIPVVDAGGNKGISEGGNTILNASASGKIADITWSPATGLSNNKILNPIAAPTSTTTYTLTVQTTAGCTATDTMTLTVLIDLFIPNTFTPNGDGINDTWNIKNLNFYTNCSVNVYNRYGEMVYSSIGYGVPWDGRYNGTNLPQGTYYYIINLNNGSKVLSGNVTIIR